MFMCLLLSRLSLSLYGYLRVLLYVCLHVIVLCLYVCLHVTVLCLYVCLHVTVLCCLHVTVTVLCNTF